MAEVKKIATGYIGNALRSATADHTTTFADEIFDTERQKYQNEVNKELENSLGNHIVWHHGLINNDDVPTTSTNIRAYSQRLTTDTFIEFPNGDYTIQYARAYKNHVSDKAVNIESVGENMYMLRIPEGYDFIRFGIYAKEEDKRTEPIDLDSIVYITKHNTAIEIKNLKEDVSKNTVDILNVSDTLSKQIINTSSSLHNEIVNSSKKLETKIGISIDAKNDVVEILPFRDIDGVWSNSSVTYGTSIFPVSKGTRISIVPALEKTIISLIKTYPTLNENIEYSNDNVVRITIGTKYDYIINDESDAKYLIIRNSSSSDALRFEDISIVPKSEFSRNKDIINNLKDGGENVPLSAEMGKELANKITRLYSAFSVEPMRLYVDSEGFIHKDPNKYRATLTLETKNIVLLKFTGEVLPQYGYKVKDKKRVGNISNCNYNFYSYNGYLIINPDKENDYLVGLFAPEFDENGNIKVDDAGNYITHEIDINNIGIEAITIDNIANSSVLVEAGHCNSPSAKMDENGTTYFVCRSTYTKKENEYVHFNLYSIDKDNNIVFLKEIDNSIFVDGCSYGEPSLIYNKNGFSSANDKILIASAKNNGETQIAYATFGDDGTFYKTGLIDVSLEGMPIDNYPYYDVDTSPNSGLCSAKYKAIIPINLLMGEGHQDHYTFAKAALLYTTDFVTWHQTSFSPDDHFVWEYAIDFDTDKETILLNGRGGSEQNWERTKRGRVHLKINLNNPNNWIVDVGDKLQWDVICNASFITVNYRGIIRYLFVHPGMIGEYEPRRRLMVYSSIDRITWKEAIQITGDYELVQGYSSISYDENTERLTLVYVGQANTEIRYIDLSLQIPAII